MVRRFTVLSLIVLLLLAAFVTGLTPVGTVAAAASPAKQKVVYFQNATKTIGGSSEFIMNTMLPTMDERVEQFTSASVTFGWFLDPPLAGDLVLNGTATAHLWMRLLDAKGAGTTQVTLGLGLYSHHNGSTVVILDETAVANKKTHGFVTSHFSEYEVSGQITEVVVAAGARLEVRLLIDSNEAVTKRIAWGSDDFRSRVQFPAATRIAVDQIRAFNTTGDLPAFFDPNDNITINATIVDPFGGYDIVWVNMTLEAPDGSLLFDREPMARTTGNDTSYASTFELNWPDIPKVKGTYNMTVQAVDKTGFHYRFPDRPGDETFGDHLESLTVLLAVGEIIWVNFLLLDGRNRPLDGARLELWDATILAASGISNETGRLNLTGVPGPGDYTARGYWEDVRVLDQTVNVPGIVDEDEAITLTLGVYDPILRVVDDARLPLGDATVFLTHPNGTVLAEPVSTDAQGDIALTRAPTGTYTLRIIWSGVTVGVKAVVVASNDVHLVVADVFYLRLRALDQDGRAVAGVHITVTDVSRALIADSQLSDAEGSMVSRLPKATYRVEANWLGAGVGSIDAIALTANQTVDLSLAIFAVSLTMTDQQEIPLEGATVEVTFEGFKAGGTTDASGRLSLQMPGGDVSLKVWWKDVLVFEGSKTVASSSVAHTIQTQVYHIPVKAVDKDGNPLAGVSLTLYREGVPVDGGITGVDGIYTFRQPVGSYTVVAKLDTTYLLSDIDQTAEVSFSLPTDQPVEVRFAEFAPPFTGTTLFPVTLGIVGLIAVLGFLVFRWKRRGGGRQPEPPEPPRPPES